MKKKTFLLFAVSLIFIGAFGAYAIHSDALGPYLDYGLGNQSENSILVQKARASVVDVDPSIDSLPQSSEQPLLADEYVLWEAVFRLDLSFRRKALEQELMGQPVTSFKSYFREEVGLTEGENEILRQTAIEYLEEMLPIEAQANQILADLREQFPDGQVEAGKEVPPPPPGLEALQEQRNAAALNGRDKLISRLGSKTFQNFDEFVKTKFTENFQSITPPREQ